MIRKEFSVEKCLIFTVESNNNKKCIGIIGSSKWQIFHKQTLNLNLILNLLSEDKFLLSLSHLLSVSVSVFL